MPEGCNCFQAIENIKGHYFYASENVIVMPLKFKRVSYSAIENHKGIAAIQLKIERVLLLCRWKSQGRYHIAIENHKGIIAAICRTKRI